MNTIEYDTLGVPLIPHRPLQILNLYGGAADIKTTAIQLNLLHFLTGIPVAKLYDAVIASSAAAIVAVDFLKPEHNGSTEPMYPDCAHAVDQMNKDLPVVFPKELRRGFYGLRSLKDAWFETVLGMVNHAKNRTAAVPVALAQRAERALTPPAAMREHPSIKPHLRSAFFAAAQWAIDAPDYMVHLAVQDMTAKAKLFYHTRRAKNDQRLEQRRREKTNRAHFDIKVLSRCLAEQCLLPMRVGSPILGRKLKVSDITTVKTFLIPSIKVANHRPDEIAVVRRNRLRFDARHITPIPQQWAGDYDLMTDAAVAITRSCALPTVLTPDIDHKDPRIAYIDPGSDGSADKTVPALLRLWSNQQNFAVTIMDCGLELNPSAISAQDLAGGYLAGGLASMNDVNARAYASAGNLTFQENARCQSMHILQPSTPFDCGDIPPDIRATLESFAQTQGVDVAAVLHVDDPVGLDSTTRLDSSPETQDHRGRVGVRSCAINFPEMVDLARQLVKSGPFSDERDLSEIAEVLARIDRMAPVHEIDTMIAGRTYHEGEPDDPYNVTMHKKRPGRMSRPSLHLVQVPAANVA